MAEPVRILTLNAISSTGLRRLPSERYSVGAQVDGPHAILVRSHDMNAMDIAASVRAIGRAGAGTNNIPVAEMSKRGVPVFNAPGANANAVKELVLAGMLIAALAGLADGRFLLAWTEDTGGAKGGSMAWQLYDQDGSRSDAE